VHLVVGIWMAQLTPIQLTPIRLLLLRPAAAAAGAN